MRIRRSSRSATELEINGASPTSINNSSNLLAHHLMISLVIHCDVIIQFKHSETVTPATPSVLSVSMRQYPNSHIQ